MSLLRCVLTAKDRANRAFEVDGHATATTGRRFCQVSPLPSKSHSLLDALQACTTSPSADRKRGTQLRKIILQRKLSQRCSCRKSSVFLATCCAKSVLGCLEI
jgi:hypothetical protein